MKIIKNKIHEQNKRKTRKSITKRFKITKNGKILRRQTGQNHFRAKKSGSKKMALRKFVELSVPESKVIRKTLGLKALKKSKREVRNIKSKITNNPNYSEPANQKPKIQNNTI